MKKRLVQGKRCDFQRCASADAVQVSNQISNDYVSCFVGDQTILDQYPLSLLSLNGHDHGWEDSSLSLEHRKWIAERKHQEILAWFSCVSPD